MPLALVNSNIIIPDSMNFAKTASIDFMILKEVLEMRGNETYRINLGLIDNLTEREQRCLCNMVDNYSNVFFFIHIFQLVPSSPLRRRIEKANKKPTIKYI